MFWKKLKHKDKSQSQILERDIHKKLEKIVEREIKDDNVRRVVAVCCYSLERFGTGTDVCWSGPQNVGGRNGWSGRLCSYKLCTIQLWYILVSICGNWAPMIPFWVQQRLSVKKKQFRNKWSSVFWMCSSNLTRQRDIEKGRRVAGCEPN